VYFVQKLNYITVKKIKQNKKKRKVKTVFLQHQLSVPTYDYFDIYDAKFVVALPLSERLLCKLNWWHTIYNI